jgi:hypothetical protein
MKRLYLTGCNHHPGRFRAFLQLYRFILLVVGGSYHRVFCMFFCNWRSAFPRLALLFVWLFTLLVNRSFSGGILLPLLGIIFLPFTTLIYVLVYIPGIGVTGWGCLCFAVKHAVFHGFFP